MDWWGSSCLPARPRDLLMEQTKREKDAMRFWRNANRIGLTTHIIIRVEPTMIRSVASLGRRVRDFSCSMVALGRVGINRKRAITERLGRSVNRRQRRKCWIESPWLVRAVLRFLCSLLFKSSSTPSTQKPVTFAIQSTCLHGPGAHATATLPKILSAGLG